MIAVGPLAAADPGPRLSVQLKDGTVIHGVLDARTDARVLGLAFSESDVLVRRAIPWTEIQTISEENRTLSPERVMQMLTPSMASTSQREFEQASIGSYSEIPSKNPEATPLPRVDHVRAEVIPDNWDRDVEPDGLCLRLLPIGSAGHPIPVQGQLTARLIARRFDEQRRIYRFVELGRWQQLVQPYHVSEEGAMYRLPYRSANPNWQLDVGSEALVHLRLLAQGSGSFEISLPVRLRAVEWARDQQQLTTGSRFFPGETTRARGPGPARSEEDVPHF